MTRQHGRLITNLDMKGIGFDDHVSPSTFDWHRVPIGFVASLAVRGKTGRRNLTTIIVKGRQTAQIRAFVFPGLPNGHWLSVEAATILLEAFLYQVQVEFLEGCDLWDGYEVVA